MHDLAARMRVLDRSGKLALPPPGSGSTVQRHQALFEFGRADLALARLAEAHTDAMAIFVEAARIAPVGKLYGVWAADGPMSLLKACRTRDGRMRLDGVKRYCSGAALLDSALVTAREVEDVILLDVPLSAPGLSIDSTEWAAPAFAKTATATVSFDNVVLEESVQLGPPGWYLTRPGFWHGAIGPAACWAGGASGLVDATRKLKRRDPHCRAQLGALEAAEWGLRAVLSQAALEIDADPGDAGHDGQRRALIARHLIERMCTDVLDRFGRATGPQLLAFDAQIAQRYAELTLYIRQCHAERDLACIPSESEGAPPVRPA
jgi:alkylation response protein AidB-like acyl-CoA dehydrogenase